MSNSSDAKVLHLTVFYDENTDEFCYCSGNFYKTCPLRAAHNLTCKESFVRITPVDREDPEVSNHEDLVRSLNKSFEKLRSSLSDLKKPKFRY